MLCCWHSLEVPQILTSAGTPYGHIITSLLQATYFSIEIDSVHCLTYIKKTYIISLGNDRADEAS
jgi:hypothetical protein